MTAHSVSSEHATRRHRSIDIDARVEQLARHLAKTAAERDRVGGHAAAERQLIRESGLLDLSVPCRYGGHDRHWSEILSIVRRLAEADSALAHIFAFHHLQIATVRLFGQPHQTRRLLTKTIEDAIFWGNAINPRDTRCKARAGAGGGYVFTGEKSFCSGSVGADWLTVSAIDEATNTLVIGAIAADRDGVTVHGDWDAMGQRQTDSGSVGFDKVVVPADDVLLAAGQPMTASMDLRSCLAQLVLVNLYIGIAEGATQNAVGMARARPRAWMAADVAKATDDPYLQHRVGRIWVGLRAAQALADEAGRAFDKAFEAAVDPACGITSEQRGRIAVAVAEAKVAAHDIALSASSELFELAGTAAVNRHHNLDRFWRNARTHTLHDPIDYKLRDLGRWALLGAYPEPTSYS